MMITPKKKFEPSAGIGSFLSYAKNYSDKYHFTCVELDTISANILKHLHLQKSNNL